MQLGNINAPAGREDVVAGFATTGLGYCWADAPTKPTLWLYYDHASGDRSPTAGRSTTFNQLYPFGHYYLGWATWWAGRTSTTSTCSTTCTRPSG